MSTMSAMPNPNPPIRAPIPPEDLIPFYLADRIPLESAVESATHLPTPKSNLLAPLLKESRSLPRSIDTDPMTPTPDLPSPAQEKLLVFMRALSSQISGQGAGSNTNTGLNWNGNGGKARDSGVGVGILLDDLVDEEEQQQQEEEEEGEDQYSTLHKVLNASVSDFSAQFQSHRRDTSPFRAEHEHEHENQNHESPSTNLGQRRSTTTTRRRRRTSSLGRHRRPSTGIEKHLYNLLSFLAFLTKERLLLQPGVGERVAAEMVWEVLGVSSLPYSHSHSHGHSHRHSHSHSHVNGNGIEGDSGWDRVRSRNRSRTDPGPGLGVEFASGMSMGQGQGLAVHHEPWFGGFVGNDVKTTAVALWLIVMGEELYQRAREEVKRVKAREQAVDEGKGKGVYTGGGRSAWSQLSSVVVWEWETWTTRLQFLSLREDLAIDAREQAAEAAAVMRRVYRFR